MNKINQNRHNINIAVIIIVIEELFKMKKFDIVMVDLGDNEAGVQSKRRPCLVVANSEKSLTSIVLPITSKQNHSWYRTHVSVGKESGLLKDSQILCEQIKTVAKTKIGKKVAEVKDVHIQERINEAMKFTIGL